MVSPEAVKYGLMTDVANFSHLTTSSLHNIGDNIQSHAVEHLYATMGIGTEQIVRLNRYDFRDYDGRHGYVVMPMCAYFTLGNAQSPFPLSPFIIPVYFSFGLSTDVDDPSLLAHFRRYEPIGTRDEQVMRMFRQRDVAAFVSGCLTIAFPRRESLPLGGKVFLVDVPDELLDYLPPELLPHVERVSHMHPYLTAPADQAEADRLDTLARQYLDRYAKEARLVVTSRLHCAAPCLAMGIPTIVVAHNISDRFAWLDRYVRIHTREAFAEIDWAVAAPDLEEAKQAILRAAAQQIEMTRARWAPLAQISAFYEARQRSDYNNMMLQSLNRLLPSELKPLRFAFWGATTHGVRLTRALRDWRPGSELVCVIDEYVQADNFCGVRVVRSSVLTELQREGVFVFIATYVGREYAATRLDEHGLAYGCLFDDLLTYHALS